MNDVDFLPQWYKENRRRQQSVQRQYVILAALFLVMIVWNSVALRSIKRVSAELSVHELQQRQAEHVSFEHQDLMEKMKRIEETVLSLERLDSRVDVAAILAELSALVDDNTVLQQVELLSVPYAQEQVAWTREGAAEALSDPEALTRQLAGWAQISVFLQGVAQKAGDVAEFIRALEASPYFSQVHLKYSKYAPSAAQPQVDENTPDAQLSEGAVEFAIDCLLAHIGQIDDDA